MSVTTTNKVPLFLRAEEGRVVVATHKKSGGYVARGRTRAGDAVRVINVEKSRGGREVWRLASDGRIKTITTSGSSTRAMDEAESLYGRALSGWPLGKRHYRLTLADALSAHQTCA